jgi:hypothetical protein
MAKSTKITIETESLLIMRGRTSRRAWCVRCAEQVEMISLDSTGVVSNLTPSELEEWLNSGDLHRSQTPEGANLVCLNSLLARMRNTKVG